MITELRISNHRRSQRLGAQRESSLCNAKYGEKDERDDTEPAAYDHVPSDGPVDCQINMASRDGNRHHAVLSTGQGREDRIRLECEKASVDVNLPGCVAAQMQNQETSVRNVGGELAMLCAD